MTTPDVASLLPPLAAEHAPCWVLVIDRDHRIVAANRMFRERFPDSVGRRCYEVFKDAAEPCSECLAVTTWASGEATQANETGCRPGGESLSYRVHAVPVPAGSAPSDCVALLALDRSREVELDRELTQAEHMATVGLTTAGLAHTVKNILSGLEGGMYMLSSGLERENPERITGAWEMVQKYVDQVNTLVCNLVDYAKADKPTREQIDPASLLEQVLELYESKADLADIAIERDVAAELPKVWMDPQGIHSCLANLISNAVDACAWDPDSAKAHAVRCTLRPRDGGGVVIAVADNGMGISEDNQAKILRSSFTTKGMRGTGLGLLLNRKVVEAHRGRIDFTSTPGEGTTFTIELPAGEPATD